MNVFEAVKQTVTTRQAAENYGIRVNRAGKANCPFHNDRTPSMKVDKRFHCFGCGAYGDVIDFTAQLYGLDAKSAAEKLAVDFQIPYTHYKRKETVKKTIREKSEEQMYRDLEAKCFKVPPDPGVSEPPGMGRQRTHPLCSSSLPGCRNLCVWHRSHAAVSVGSHSPGIQTGV